MLRFLHLFRVVARSAGRAAFQRAAPFYFALLIAATIIFSPLGMDAADVTSIVARFRPFRLCLWGLWLLATTPAARALLSEPSLFVLRSLPVRRAHFFLAQGILLLAIEAPWALLFFRGAGGLQGLSAVTGAMAAHALIVARPQRIADRIAAAALVGGLAWPLPPLLFFALCVGALAVGITAAWVRAPEGPVGPQRPRVFGAATRALATAYLLTLWRAHAALLGRFVLLMLLGAAVAALSIRNNQIQLAEPRSALTLGILSAVLLLGASGLCGPVVRSERRARWLLHVCGVTSGKRMLSAALALAFVTTLLDALAALLVGGLLHGTGSLLLRLAGCAALGGASMGVIAYACARWAQRGDKKDGQRTLLSILVGLLAIALATWALHEWVLAALVLAAMLLSVRVSESAHPALRWQRLKTERSEGDLW